MVEKEEIKMITKEMKTMMECEVLITIIIIIEVMEEKKGIIIKMKMVLLVSIMTEIDQVQITNNRGSPGDKKKEKKIHNTITKI